MRDPIKKIGKTATVGRFGTAGTVAPARSTLKWETGEKLNATNNHIAGGWTLSVVGRYRGCRAHLDARLANCYGWVGGRW